jgi:5-methylcytosine-specific restriction endonuclease McrA
MQICSSDWLLQTPHSKGSEHLDMTKPPDRRPSGKLGRISEVERKELYAAAKNCPYCAKTLGHRPHERSIDRIIHDRPYRDQNDVLDWNNLVVCCFQCNVRKKDKSYVEWVSILPRADAKRAAHLYRDRYGEFPLSKSVQIPLFPSYRTTGYVPGEDDE